MEKIGKYIKSIIRIVRYGKTAPTHFFTFDKKEVVYIVVPKCACSSIMQTFSGQNEYSDQTTYKKISNQYIKWRLTSKSKKYYKFTFVRNPFDRVVSCYAHKVQNRDSSTVTKNYFFANIKPRESFDDFVKHISKIPDFLADSHFQSQVKFVYYFGKPLFDYIGHYENLESEFEPIRTKYNLHPLPRIHNMKKGDWRDYYTEHTAKIVYEKYKKDFNKLGYEKEYDNLIKYIQSKK